MDERHKLVFILILYSYLHVSFEYVLAQSKYMYIKLIINNVSIIKHVPS